MTSRTPSRRYAHLGAALLAACLALAAPASAADVYERGNAADPLTLDPQRATSVAEANILRDLYEGLVAYDAAGRLVPGVAGGWSAAADGLAVTFTLRPSFWSDGTRVTAYDFVRAFRRLMDPRTAAPDAPLFAGIANAAGVLDGRLPVQALGVRAVSPEVLEFTLDAPMPQLPQLLARPSAMPVAATAYRGGIGPGLSNGAYTIGEFQAGLSLRLEANPAFRDAAMVAIPTVVYRPYDPATAVARFREGALLTANDLPVFAAAALREELGEAVRVSPFLGTYLLAFRAGAASVSDRGVRQALALAIDRDRLNAEAFSGLMVPAASLVPPGLAGYEEPPLLAIDADGLDGRRTEARALLSAAGYGAERPLTVALTVPARDLDRSAAAAIAADWAEIGVSATVVEAGAGYATAVAGAYEVAAVGWIADSGDATAFLGLLATGAATNFTGYSDPDYDAVLAEAGVTYDSEVRSALLYKAEALALRDLPLVPLLHYSALNLVSDRLAGWQDNVLDIHPSRWLSFAPSDTP